MTIFSPAGLVQTPQTVSDYLTDIGGAPAALVSISDGTLLGASASGTTQGGGTAAQPDQTFEIGSQTKMMTAAVVLQLVEEGLVDLDQTLAHYLEDDLIDGVSNADIATVSQALNMTTGMVNYTDAERPDGKDMLDIVASNPDAVFGTDQIITFLNGLPADAPVGAGYAYSNTDYFYLSQVIEAVTGQTLGDVLQERIFDPLNMQNSFLNDFRNDPSRVSSYLEDDGEVFDVTDLRIDANGEGGVISTTADMTIFMQALLVDQTLVSGEILATMADFQNGSTDDRGFVFGAGLVYLEVEGIGSFVGFSGGTFGTNSASYLHLETGRIISLAVTQSNLEINATTGLLYSAVLAEQDAAWGGTNIESPIHVDGISAADLHFSTSDGATTLLAEDAAMTLPGTLRDLDSDDFEFGDGSRLLLGSQDDDVLRIARTDDSAGNADNQLRGFGGDDRLIGGDGSDRSFGGHGDDVVKGRGGDDLLSGGRGADVLRGGAGDDILLGERGDDRLMGGKGDDRVKGGAGDDWMSGGGGADVFVFRGSLTDGATDHDVIADYQVGIDALALGVGSVTNVTQHNDGIEVTLDGDGDTIFLIGVSDAADLAFL